MKILFLLSLFLVSCASDTGIERKDATKFTKEANQQLLLSLPFGDTNDFAAVRRGFIGSSDENFSFAFISNQSAPDTVNPSLWRNAQLNNEHGLFEVVPGVYQIRGFDLANMTFIRGTKGWIVADVLTAEETAMKAIKLFRQHMGNDPITGVIYTHSHADHFGGSLGVVSGEDVKNGVPVVAPEGFFEESLSENVLAGNIMTRRAMMMYGNLLPKDEKGTVDAGLGKGAAVGQVGILKPTQTISRDGQTATIDGVTFEFLMAQGTEAPAEFMFYIPKYKTAVGAEVINHTMHNISTLRGAKTRNTLLWSDAVRRMREYLALRPVEALIGMHFWPTWGKANIDAMLAKYGSLYQYMHDQTLRLANMGYGPDEIAETIKLPEELANEWYNRGYYGTLVHNVKGIYDFYFGGWWDGNPANLYKLPPVDASVRYVEFMGGENKVISKAKEYFDKGEYRWVVQVLNHVIFANPKNQKARNLSADAMEQLGYQAESAVWRAYLLSGALELRVGVEPFKQAGGAFNTISPGIMTNLSLADVLKFQAVSLNPEKSKGRNIKVNITVGQEKMSAYLVYSVLNLSPTLFAAPDVSISMSRAVFNDLLLKKISFEDAIKQKLITVSNPELLKDLPSLFDKFEFWLNVVTP